MDLLNCLHNRCYDPQRGIHGKAAVLLHVILQILPFDIFHDDICRIIFNKIIVHRDEVFLSHKLCHISGFFEEILHSLLIHDLRRLRAGHVIRISGKSFGDLSGKIFLYRNMHLQLQVGTVVCYAESTLSQHMIDPVFSLQHCSGGKVC